MPIRADRHLLEQVLLNLALNAFHFMSNGGWLSIRGVDRGPAGVEIEVRDTGPGIPADDLPRIFEPGFTTRPGSRARPGGVPADARSARRAHRGREPAGAGNGIPAEFAGRRRRPAASALAAKGSAGDSGVADPDGSAGMKRMLIVDDDAGMRAALEARFARRGWQVDVAVNGAEALAKFRPGLHSLVITDVRMPGRDGFELMREVQTSSSGTAVILLTAYGCVPDAVGPCATEPAITW